MNVFGIRMRHEIFDTWLKEEKSVDYVIENLKRANFDPEFYKEYEDEVLEIYNSRFPDDKVKSISKRGLFAALTS